MSVTPKVLVAPVLLVVGTTDRYTAPVATIIDKATVTNTDTVNRNFTVYLVSSGTGVSTTNILVDAVNVVPGETYLCPELVGQILNPGDKITTEASAANALSMRVSGRQVT